MYHRPSLARPSVLAECGPPLKEVHGLEGMADGGEGRSALVRLDCLSGAAQGCCLLNHRPVSGPASAHDKGTCRFQAGGWARRHFFSGLPHGRPHGSQSWAQKATLPRHAPPSGSPLADRNKPDVDLLSLPS
uniref:Uncharacterized protein n=1 Tax=Micrurus lemniscatus lemniscatus TaxID=129467 RepID=A0A2D4ILN8_MICLE